MSEEKFQEVLDMVREAYEPSEADQNRIYQAVIAAPLLPAAVAWGRGLTSLFVVKGVGVVVLVLALGAGVYLGVTHVTADDTDIGVASVASKSPQPDAGVAMVEKKVTPAKAGVQKSAESQDLLDSRRRGNDESQKNNFSDRDPITEIEGNSEKSQITPTERPKSSSLKKHRKQKSSKAAPESSNTLADEVALVRDAAGAINAGKMKRARRLLNAHRTRFPQGVMVQERNGLEIIALCKQGKDDVAARRFAAFKKMSPNAPIIIRINKTCGFR